MVEQLDEDTLNHTLERANGSELGAVSKMIRACTYARTGLLALILSFVIFCLPVMAQSGAPSEADVEARLERGYARIVFDFNRLPKYSKKIIGTILILSFSDPVKMDLAPVYKEITNYITVARRDPDGRAVRFAMSQRFKVNMIEAGNKLFVDLLPRNWVGLPPSLPKDVIAELARVSAEVEAKQREEARQRRLARAGYMLKVRVAKHKTFSRIVFDWNKFVVASVAREGGLVRVKFGVRADIELGRIRSNPPPRLRNIKKVETDRGMEIQLEIDPKANVRGFREGFSYVVDLTGLEEELNGSVVQTMDKVKGKEAAQSSANEEVKLSSKPEEEAQSPKENPVPAEDVNGWAANTQTEDARPDDSAVLSNDDLILKPEEVEEDAPPASYAEAELEEVSEPRDVEVSNDEAVNGPKDPEPASAKSEMEEPDPLRPQKARTKTKASAKAEQLDDDDDELEEKLTVTRAKNGVKLTFRFDNQIPASVFRRGKTIWIVLDTKETIDFKKIDANIGDVLQSAEQETVEDTQIIRLRLTKAWLPSAQYKDNAWIVEAGELISDKAIPIALKRGLRSDQKSVVTVDMQRPGKLHWLTDPELGDRLAVVTAYPPIRSVIKPHHLVDFEALATAHGLAIKPKVDDLAVRVRPSDILITRAPGLIVSAGKARQYAPGQKSLARNDAERVGYIDFRGWRRGGDEKYAANLSDLEHAVAVAEAAERNHLRLDLARFYIAHRLAPEVLGTLRQIISSDPEANSDPVINILRGAANTLMGRYDQARKDLNVHALAHDNDAALWRGLVNQHQARFEDALKDFANGADVVSHYPEDLQARFRLAAAAAALESRLLSRAADELEALPAVNLSTSLIAEADLIRGRYYERTGRSDEALDAYKRVIRAKDRVAEAKARLRIIDLLLRQKKLELDKALEELESLSIVWRGDRTELGTLRLLANLYAKKGKYRQAFETMKHAIKAFPDQQLAQQIQDDMKEIFRDKFLYGRGKTMPVTAEIGLFYDYRELTPVGRLGDEMIRRLADRLISVELLDQASELLEHQVNNRLTGSAKAQVAVRLAMVHLMNAKPQLALRTLRKTSQPDLPAATKRARDVLEARALGELGRASSAIDLLGRLDGDDIERLRGDVYWNAQKWRPAGEQFEKMLGARWQDSEKLKKEERFDVLRAAISYSLAEDKFALNRLRKKFYNKMVQSDDAEAFILVTQPVTSRSKEFDKLVKDIASSSTLDAFMKGFKRNLDKEQAGRRSEEPADQTEPRPFG